MSMAICAICGTFTDTDMYPDIGETADFEIICQDCNLKETPAKEQYHEEYP